VQQVFMELYEEWPSFYFENLCSELESQLETIKGAGVEVIELPAADMETWKNMPQIKSMPEDWVKRVSGETKIPESRLREIMERFMELLPEYAERYPQEI
jgi:hypothetical protein